MGKRKSNCSHGKAWEIITSKNVSVLAVKIRIGMGLILRTAISMVGREGIDEVLQ